MHLPDVTGRELAELQIDEDQAAEPTVEEQQIDLTERPLSRRVMARWRAVNSSFMATSVVRPLAVAHGGDFSRRG